MFLPIDQYTFMGFEKSSTKNKKYNGIFKNIDTGKLKKLPFGDRRYSQYKDSTGLGLFSHLDHVDPKRRALYRKRHSKDIKKGYYSNGLLSMRFLW